VRGARGAGAGACASRTGPRHRARPADQLFVPFARLGAEQTDVEGTGLGLALSQRLCEAMGGALVSSRAGRRAACSASSCAAADPLRRGEETAPRAREFARRARREATLLYVEDNLANLSLVETILLARPGGADPGAAGAARRRAGARARARPRAARPAPARHPGDEVLRRLRADPRTARSRWSSSAPTRRPTVERLRRRAPTRTSPSRSTCALFLRTSSSGCSRAVRPAAAASGRRRRGRAGRLHDPARRRRGGEPRPARGACCGGGASARLVRTSDAREAVPAARARRAPTSCCSTCTCRTARLRGAGRPARAHAGRRVPAGARAHRRRDRRAPSSARWPAARTTS
jgi:hypothetical protein